MLCERCLRKSLFVSGLCGLPVSVISFLSFLCSRLFKTPCFIHRGSKTGRRRAVGRFSNRGNNWFCRRSYCIRRGLATRGIFEKLIFPVGWKPDGGDASWWLPEYFEGIPTEAKKGCAEDHILFAVGATRTAGSWRFTNGGNSGSALFIVS